MLALSYLAGGHVRIGLEDSVYWSKKARRIVQVLAGQIASPAEARAIVGLPARVKR